MQAALADDMNYAVLCMLLAVQLILVFHGYLRPTSNAGEVDVHHFILGILTAGKRYLTTLGGVLRFHQARVVDASLALYIHHIALSVFLAVHRGLAALDSKARMLAGEAM